MSECLDLTEALALRPYPNARPLRAEHWSTFSLKKLIFFSNLFWICCLVAASILLFCAYVVMAEYQSKTLSAAERMKELEMEISRLQDLNFYTAAQTITLAKNIQVVIDSADNGPQRDFLKMVVPEAIKLQINYRIPASATIAMAIFESRYGMSDLAKTHHNFFGLKAFDSAWDGPKTYQATVDRGQPTQAYFRSYADSENGIVGYGKFLTASDRYKGAFNYKRGDQFVQAVLAAGYCPDKDYLSHIKALMDRHHLTTLDLPDTVETSQVSSPAKMTPILAISKAKTPDVTANH